MVVGVIVGTYSSIYIASPLLIMFGEGAPKTERAKVAAAEAALTGRWGRFGQMCRCMRRPLRVDCG